MMAVFSQSRRLIGCSQVPALLFTWHDQATLPSALSGIEASSPPLQAVHDNGVKPAAVPADPGGNRDRWQQQPVVNS